MLDDNLLSELHPGAFSGLIGLAKLCVCVCVRRVACCLFSALFLEMPVLL